ncbi:hypothetical protein MLD38_014898 [Melastoma candidum]|uniref:Uncharacterized protein n=1 Tax=Melastoma candidum TaxID=119954 RepID=A0ACB9RE79_9MYRT|nr:hypothetical protein MLD38_014898 [Melastoma candidum]
MFGIKQYVPGERVADGGETTVDGIPLPNSGGGVRFTPPVVVDSWSLIMWSGTFLGYRQEGSGGTIYCCEEWGFSCDANFGILVLLMAWLCIYAEHPWRSKGMLFHQDRLHRGSVKEDLLTKDYTHL